MVPVSIFVNNADWFSVSLSLTPLISTQVNHDLHKQYQKKKADLGLHDNTSLMLVKESITEYIVKR